ncbi:unnamed protein product [Microthlaspi erraticum]|uniref:Uncharacterized protein n=1 Tax=Microthlaspi erraticum TaxID=1685480 RepID=A0A6D2IXD4_9BRAS|nr:unnamed protein product [Microthlaspi erraticum]
MERSRCGQSWVDDRCVYVNRSSNGNFYTASNAPWTNGDERRCHMEWVSIKPWWTPRTMYDHGISILKVYPSMCILRTYPGKGGVGIPKRCRCGNDVALHTTHDGRKFFECTGNTIVSDGQAHVKTWWEEAITEQFDELYDELDDINTQLTYIAMDCGRFKKLVEEVEGLKENVTKREEKSGRERKFAVVCSVLVVIMGLVIVLVK